MRRLLDYNPETGVREIFEATDDGFRIHYQQDVEGILERNKSCALDGKWGGGRDRSGEFQKVAEIPIVVQMKWLTEEGIDVYNKDHWKAVQRKLNSNEYRYLKTAEVII